MNRSRWRLECGLVHGAQGIVYRMGTLVGGSYVGVLILARGRYSQLYLQGGRSDGLWLPVV